MLAFQTSDYNTQFESILILGNFNGSSGVKSDLEIVESKLEV